MTKSTIHAILAKLKNKKSNKEKSKKIADEQHRFSDDLQAANQKVVPVKSTTKRRQSDNPKSSPNMPKKIRVEIENIPDPDGPTLDYDSDELTEHHAGLLDAIKNIERADGNTNAILVELTNSLRESSEADRYLGNRLTGFQVQAVNNSH
jgi:hypothetical protein